MILGRPIGLIRALVVLALTSAPAGLVFSSSGGDSQHGDLATEILAELVPIESTVDHPDETIRALTLTAKRLTDAGFPARDVEIVQSKPGSSALVARYRGGADSGAVMLIAHMDVVGAEPESWAFDPFTFAADDGHYYGRGTQDNKAGVAHIVANFIRLRGEGFVPDRDLIAVITGDEEISGDAMSYLVRERRDLIDAELGLSTDAGGGDYRADGTPRCFYVQTSEKVYQSYRLTATGPGGHSSQPGSDNTIYRLAAALTRLAAHQFPVELNDDTRGFFKRSAPFSEGATADDMAAVAGSPPDLEAGERLASASPYFNAMLRTTCVATVLEAGKAENALPRSASAVVNCRILPGVDATAVEAELRRVIDDEGVAVEALWDDFSSPASTLSPEMMTLLEELAEEMWPGAPVIPRMSAGATDSLFVRNAGIPVFGVAGWFRHPDDNRAHGLNERIAIRDFDQGTEFWYRLLKRLAGPAQ